MRRHKIPAFCLIALVMAVAMITLTSCTHSQPRSSGSEWRTVLDANHTNGWTMVGPGAFKWENGELVTYGGMGLLFYQPERFGNCRIRVVFKLTAEDDNSGVFVRIAEPPKDPWQAVHHGYEVQIANKGDESHRTGTLYSFTKAKNIVDSKVGEWTTMVITLDGKRTLAHINGVLVTDFTEGDPVPEKKIWYEPERRPRVDVGYIGLQNHGGDAHVHFKEVSIAPLK